MRILCNRRVQTLRRRSAVHRYGKLPHGFPCTYIITENSTECNIGTVFLANCVANPRNQRIPANPLRVGWNFSFSSRFESAPFPCLRPPGLIPEGTCSPVASRSDRADRRDRGSNPSHLSIRAVRTRVPPALCTSPEFKSHLPQKAKEDCLKAVFLCFGPSVIIGLEASW